MEWTGFVEFLWVRARELVDTEFDQVRYADVGMAFWLSIVVTVAGFLTVARMSFTRRKHSREHSGHLIERRFQRGPVVRMLYHLPKLLLASAVAVVLVAVSDPFLTATEEVGGDVQSRVRIDLVDTSLSMTWEFSDTGLSRAQIAREAHLQFLEMRRAKNDRVSLWLFSSYPYMVDDFVLDDDLYYFQVMEAPYVTVKVLAAEPGAPHDQMFVPPDKVRIIPTEGTTQISRALQAIVRYSDSDAAVVGSRTDPHRAILIITDADVDGIPEAELAELNTRNIVPYIIYINAGGARTAMDEEAETPPLIEMIRDFGGDYFDATDLDSLQRAYEAVDERETVRVELTHRAVKVPIYSRLLLVSMALLVVGIQAGLVAELLWGTHP